jgi:ribosome-binding factor A
MEETKRQKQVAQLLLKELNEIFLRQGLTIIDGCMVSIVKVKITPDLLEAKVYLSFFNTKDSHAIYEKIMERASEIKRDLGNKIKNQVRRIPSIQYFEDDTLDYVFKMEELFKKIEEDKKGN